MGSGVDFPYLLAPGRTLIFLGDVASPVEPNAVEDLPWRNDALVVANLEGPIAADPERLLNRKVLCNHPSVLPWLSRLGVRLVTLANNHIMDVHGSLGFTLEAVDEAGLARCGAGLSGREAGRAAMLKENGRPRVFLAFGWPVIGCLPAGRERPGVNPLRPERVHEAIVRTRQENPDATLVLLMHWGYELEAYPMPMDRELAFRAVDAGAAAVIGCHAHCVQGAECYKGAPIIYGLGNWLLMQGEYFDGRLRFPQFASRQLALEWEPESSAVTCHWFDYSSATHTLRRTGSEPLEASQRMAELTPFRGMPRDEYVRWFQKNRRKRTLLPIYRDPDARRTNALRDWWVGRRQDLISLGLRLGLKGGPR